MLINKDNNYSFSENNFTNIFICTWNQMLDKLGNAIHFHLYLILVKWDGKILIFQLQKNKYRLI